MNRFLAITVSLLALPVAAFTLELPPGETVWHGAMEITETVFVPKGATLRIEPGTRIVVKTPAPPSPPAEPPPAISVKGSLLVDGETDRSVLFEGPGRLGQNEDVIYVLEAEEVVIRGAVFEKGGWALHIHETPTRIEGCVFRGNYGGLRFHSDGLVLTGNRFEENKIGVRVFHAARVRVERNVFLKNLTGLFLREGIVDPVIEGNLFDDVEYDVKLGAGQAEDVAAPRNYWRAHETGTLPGAIFDREDDELLGRVLVEPVLTAPGTLEAK